MDETTVFEATGNMATREEIARQLAPLLEQFEATYEHETLLKDELYLALRRVIFVAQYHAYACRSEAV